MERRVSTAVLLSLVAAMAWATLIEKALGLVLRVVGSGIAALLDRSPRPPRANRRRP
jgi:hypothetical protein